MNALMTNINELAVRGVIKLIPDNGFSLIQLCNTYQEFVDSEEDLIMLNNLGSSVIDNNGLIVCRGMPVLNEYDDLPRAIQSEFLSDKITMIEYIQGKNAFATLLKDRVLIFSHSNETKSYLIDNGFDKLLKPILKVASSKNEIDHSISLKITPDKQVFLEAIVSNSIEPEFFEERSMDLMVRNFSTIGDKIKRPMHYTTSLNESNHKPNTEWIMRNNDMYCLMLNKLKNTKSSKNS